MIPSQVNSIYDPLGLAGLFTVRAKIMMRKLWGSEMKLVWDDPVPEEARQGWKEFFKDLFQMEEVKFKRCVKPNEAVGDPTLVTFSDGSQDAYGACSYARWECNDGKYRSSLVASKNRLSPVKKINIADWITQGKKPSETGPDSVWQNGSEFLTKPVSEWPVEQTFNGEELPERIRVAMATNATVTNIPAAAIDITRYSSYNKLMRVTARIIATASKNPRPSLKNIGKTLTPTYIQKAETFWIKKAQESMKKKIDEGEFKRLCLRTRDDGIVVVGGRAEKWLQMSYDQQEVVPFVRQLTRTNDTNLSRKSSTRFGKSGFEIISQASSCTKNGIQPNEI